MNISIVILLCILFFAYKAPLKTLIFVLVCYPTLVLFRVPIFCVPSFLGYYYLLIIVKKNYCHEDSPFPFKFPFIIIITSFILTTIFAPNKTINVLDKMGDLALIYSIWTMYQGTKENNVFFLKNVLLYGLVCCLYGVYEEFSGQNPFILFMYEHNMITVMQQVDRERFGWLSIQSLTIWREAFGVVCCITLFFLLNAYYKKMIISKVFVCAFIILILFCSIACGSRSTIVAIVIMLCCIIPYLFEYRMKSFLFIIFGVLLYIGNHDLVDEIVFSIVHQDEYSGSSIEMRELQLTSLFNIIGSDILFGVGLGTIGQYTGKYHDTLYGLEGIVLTTLLYRGIFGLVSIFVLWFESVRYTIKCRQFGGAFLLLSFYADKLLTLTATLNEAFILFYLIPILKNSDFLLSEYHIDSNKSK